MYIVLFTLYLPNFSFIIRIKHYAKKEEIQGRAR